MNADTRRVDLAQWAREALADGLDATLMIAGIGRLGATDPDAILYDDNGRPTFICEATSSIVAAAGQSALLSVSAHRGGLIRTTVILAGRLSVVSDEQPRLEVALVALDVDQIVVECDDPRATVLVHEQVPLELYRRARADTVDCYAQSVAAHFNRAHEPELRAYAASRAGIRTDQVAGAGLVHLDRHCAGLAWVDVGGAHDDVIDFAVPADNPAMLAGLLRQHLQVAPEL